MKYVPKVFKNNKYCRNTKKYNPNLRNTKEIQEMQYFGQAGRDYWGEAVQLIPARTSLDKYND